MLPGSLSRSARLLCDCVDVPLPQGDEVRHRRSKTGPEACSHHLVLLLCSVPSDVCENVRVEAGPSVVLFYQVADLGYPALSRLPTSHHFQVSHHGFCRRRRGGSRLKRSVKDRLWQRRRSGQGRKFEVVPGESQQAGARWDSVHCARMSRIDADIVFIPVLMPFRRRVPWIWELLSDLTGQGQAHGSPPIKQ